MKKWWCRLVTGDVVYWMPTNHGPTYAVPVKTYCLYVFIISFKKYEIFIYLFYYILVLFLLVYL